MVENRIDVLRKRIFCKVLAFPLLLLTAAHSPQGLGEEPVAPPPKTAAKLQRLDAFNYQSHASDGSEVTVLSSGSARLRLKFVADGVVQVWVDSQGVFKREPSYAVDEKVLSPGVPPKVTEEGDALWVSGKTVAVRIHKKPLRIDFYQADRRSLLVSEEEKHGIGWGDDGSRFAYYRMGAGEHFYGLGQDNEAYLGRLDRRGSSRDMWTGQKINKGKVTADIPIPFFLSTGSHGGYGMFFDNTYRTEFNMGKESNDYYFWRARGGDLIYYFIYGPSFQEIVTRYSALTGRPPLPALWTLGFIQSKCTYHDWAEIDEVVASMRQKQIPLDAMVIDYDWPDQMQNFKWHKRWQEQSAAKIKAYRDQGIHIMISNSGPMIRKESSNYKDGMDHGIFASDGKGSTVVCGHYGGDLMDFTAPQMKGWLWPQLRPLYDEGIAAWWLDLTEPEGEPSQTVYHGGVSANIHNVYSLLNSKMYYEMQKEYDPASRPFILTRTGWAGIQKYGTAIWSGDIASDYETFAAHCPEALNSGLSGVALWTNDSGGFLTGLYKKNMHDHGLLYERWLQFSAFAPIARAHHVGPSAPYMFGPEVQEGTKHYLSLRYQLLPYIYSYIYEAHTAGSPLMRPLVYEFQDDPAVSDLKDEYLFGRELLVAPVLKEGQTMRRVYFPKGTWIDYDNGYEVRGPKEVVVAAPQARLPLFVRAGAIIPMAPPMQHTGEKPWDPLTLDIYPRGNSSFQLYADDGRSSDYATSQKFTVTTIGSVANARGAVVTLQPSNPLFVPKNYILKLHLQQVPIGVRVDGGALSPGKKQEDTGGTTPGYFWDGTAQILWVNVAAAGGRAHKVEVRTSGRVRARPALPRLKMVDKDGDKGAAGAVRMPHFYPPPALPARIEAVNFDNGGEGVAYHVMAPGNPAGKYRKEKVALEESGAQGGGYDVLLGATGEWLTYTIQSPADALYHVTTQILAVPAATLAIEVDGVAATMKQAATSATGWTELNFDEIYLAKGEHIVKISLQKGAVRLHNLQFSASLHVRLVDELDDFNRMHAHSASISVDGSNQNAFRDDPARLNRMTATAEEIFYKLDQDIGAAVIETFYWPNGQLTDFKFYLSKDGKQYEEVTLKREDLGGDWRAVNYTLEKPATGMRYLKIVFPVIEPNWTPQIARVTIDGVRS